MRPGNTIQKRKAPSWLPRCRRCNKIPNAGLIARSQPHPALPQAAVLGDRFHGKQGFEVAALQGILQAPEKRKQRGS